MDERRKHPRARSLLAGRIAFNDRQSSLDCTVRNHSERGALIAFESGQMMPREFDFDIPRLEETHRAAVVWRHRGQAGLALSPREVDTAAARKPPRLSPRAILLAVQKARARGY